MSVYTEEYSPAVVHELTEREESRRAWPLNLRPAP
jgi:hypothetical protein